MYSFEKISIEKNINSSYINQVIALFKNHHNSLIDDYYFCKEISLENELIAFIEKTFPHFYLIFLIENNQKIFIGFVYLYNWRGNNNYIHSCTLTTCFDKKYWGKHPVLAGKTFIKSLFDNYKLEKIKAEVFCHNFKVISLLKKMNFEKEATLKNETFKNGSMIDIDVYSVFNF
ncbi:MAG: GNAT family protein [Candidatus Gastranaerophilales bacterium]|nr:GNAT family protein [Candidatus Gastranaerophilales bacterium]